MWGIVSANSLRGHDCAGEAAFYEACGEDNGGNINQVLATALAVVETRLMAMIDPKDHVTKDGLPILRSDIEHRGGKLDRPRGYGERRQWRLGIVTLEQ